MLQAWGSDHGPGFAPQGLPPSHESHVATKLLPAGHGIVFARAHKTRCQNTTTRQLICNLSCVCVLAAHLMRAGKYNSVTGPKQLRCDIVPWPFGRNLPGGAEAIIVVPAASPGLGRDIAQALNKAMRLQSNASALSKKFEPRRPAV